LSDEADARHLADGEIAWLLARYEPAVRARCIARLGGDAAAEDVAQNVMLRLLAEFHRGRRWEGVPFRVVVHQITSWTLSDHFAGRPTDAPLPDGWEPGGDDPALARVGLRELFSALPERARRVCELRYLVGLEIEEIARQLDTTRNAVDQALHRAHKQLRELVTDG
jgi:DNA-directed RNA polymerase specialized sigma24 family protein